MESSRGPPPPPNPQTIKRNLLNKGVIPTPKIIHNLRKKHLQKSLRKSNRSPSHQSLTPSQQESLDEETHFQILKSEYKAFTKAIDKKNKDKGGDVSLIGKPWESLDRGELRRLATGNGEYGGKTLKPEHLRELGDIIESEREKFRWLFLDDDVELKDGWVDKEEGQDWAPTKRRSSDVEAIRFLVDRLSGTELTVKDWKFGKMMNQSGLPFTEGQLLNIVGRLGEKGQWRHALSVVKWVYNSKELKHFKSRFVYTKLLAVLGKARRPREALQIFNLMRGDCHIYPDMPAYHSVAVTLGQAGLLKDLIKIIACMKLKPSRKSKNIRRKNWDPVLEPDLVVFNAVLNACIPSHQWRGVSWVFEQLRNSGLKPNGATYGLAMEVMMQSGKYHLVHEYFSKMNKNGEAPKALTYKVLVKTFWKEGKINEAVQAVRDMEQRGAVGTACVYYELACCLCNNGRWKEAMDEVERMKRLCLTKPLAVAFTGMILSSMDGGHIDNCALIFEQSKEHCAPDIGLINAMLKVYGRNDMFFKAKELFEDTKRASFGDNACLIHDASSLSPDAYTYSSILKASARALQWEYFDYVYKDMVVSGYRIDQRIHAPLLVEASRAGKLHLLEHAFDTVLEAGEIPNSSFFTEILCQATIRNDFDRAAAILNSMAYAPFQVSEKQWLNVFEEYGSRITKVHLEQLLDVLCNRDIAIEASVSNLSRLLQFLCASNSSNSIALGSETTCESPPHGYDKESENYKGFQVNNEDQKSEDDSDSDSDFLLEIENFGFNDDGKASPLRKENWTENLTSDEPVSSRFTELEDLVTNDDFDLDDELKLGMLTSETVESDRPKLPSAEEILGSWRESRRKDLTLSPTPQPHIS